MMSRKLGTSGADAAMFKGPEQVSFETKVSRLQEQPEKNRVAVMFFGRPAIYYASTEDRAMVDRLRSAAADGRALKVEVDASQRILSAG